MKTIPNFSYKSALANARHIGLVYVGAAALFVTSSLVCSCAGNSKGNAGNGENGIEAVNAQTAEPENNNNENSKESVKAELARVSYSIHPYDNTKEIKTFLDKDGFMNVKWIYKDGDINLFPFGLEISRNVFFDGTAVTYDPRFKSENLYYLILNELAYILTKKSLKGDPAVMKRNQEIDISQYMYYLVFNNEDADDFVKERVKMHYDVAIEQLPDEIKCVNEITNNTSSRYTFLYESSLYKDKFKIESFFDDNGNLVVSSWVSN